ncbi:C4-dicarboxylate ABC transporter substrate-binding protein [Actibacterium mucosum KCTC 23349]|uniref:TRAP transporter small permease protein n=1 Tax=Actibacterium mucosum KCTC 23349 TaxID=1454373 RepID=A0A037ZLA3_9RHOB|nr:TRAP transporter small permease [Actibacterium mucosum]KAJ56317.1 C4-dicarboxylate ABC transporter substrate-binding protein [Actibacterium mucosum KCTC 23349]
MQRFLRILWSCVDAFMVAILLAMIGMVFLNVVLRYGFSSGLREAIELSRLSLVWLVMVGAAVVMRRNEHLAVREILNLFPRPVVMFLRRLAYVIILAAVLMMFWGTFRQTTANWQNISPLTGLPTGLFYLAGIVSSILMTAISLARIYNPDAKLDGGLDADLGTEGHI